MVNEFPNLKCVFPEPPILSYRRNHNLRNLLVRSRFTPPSSNRHTSNSSPCLSKLGKGWKLCHSMNNTNFITNIQSGKTCFTSGGRCNTSDNLCSRVYKTQADIRRTQSGPMCFSPDLVQNTLSVTIYWGD